jgi:hypothetical protein
MENSLWTLPATFSALQVYAPVSEASAAIICKVAPASVIRIFLKFSAETLVPSLSHVISGCGCPEAVHSSLTGRRTITDISVTVWASSIDGGTARGRRQRNGLLS